MELNAETLWQIWTAAQKVNTGATPDITPQKTPTSRKSPLVKANQFEDELMQVTEVMYCPPEEDDLHGERMSEIEIRKMVSNFNENITNVKGNLGHIKNTEAFRPIKAWVNEVECMIGDNYVAEGTPLVKIQFYDADLYAKRKSGEILGLSIGAMGRTVNKDA